MNENNYACVPAGRTKGQEARGARRGVHAGREHTRRGEEERTRRGECMREEERMPEGSARRKKSARRKSAHGRGVHTEGECMREEECAPGEKKKPATTR